MPIACQRCGSSRSISNLRYSPRALSTLASDCFTTFAQFAVPASSARSIGPDVRVLDHLAPLGNVGADQLAKLLGLAGAYVKHLDPHFFIDLGQPDNAVKLR